MIQKNIFLFAAVLISLLACKSDPLDVSPAQQQLDIHYINLDSLLIHTQADDLQQRISATKLKQGQILDYELGHCLSVGSLEDSGTVDRLQLFKKDPFVKRLEQRIGEKFANLTPQKKKINEGFSFLKHHFPKGKVPENIVFINSFFASNVFCTENEIGIGLERYLGAKTDVIKELPGEQIFQWIKDEMRVEYLERDVLTAWIMTHYVPESKKNLADAIVYWGKIIYLTEAAFPNEKEHIVLRYTPKEYDWAIDNEYSFWKYLVDEKLLFSENERDHSNFLNDAPFTVGLPEKGPDRLGQFLGWRMVHSYMEQFPETTLEDLLKLPYNTILQEYEVD